ncbi:hypothetical protein FALBO_5120 [Fusarium albosuccineum]|uniref:Uncharacterized protein n=1 Tax=Fusarium albosuccineum TaxID=1237068 RepID=A0A8H4PD04_9HYPO|nr:hypothetical protein FALBO_5120 [Fusarium albosuccineum]
MCVNVKREDDHPTVNGIRKPSRSILMDFLYFEFNIAPPKFVQDVFKRNGDDFEKSYVELSGAIDLWNVEDPPFKVATHALSEEARNKLQSHLIEKETDENVRAWITDKIDDLRETREETLWKTVTVSLVCECCYNKKSRMNMVHCQARKRHASSHSQVFMLFCVRSLTSDSGFASAVSVDMRQRSWKSGSTGFPAYPRKAVSLDSRAESGGGVFTAVSKAH